MENKFNIGELDTLVALFSPELGKGSQGQKIFTYKEHSRVWAKVDRSIDEGVNNGNLQGLNTLELTVYKVAGLTSRWRVKVDGADYEIVSIDPISRVSPVNTLTLRAIE